jgi:hypothetical protein
MHLLFEIVEIETQTIQPTCKLCCQPDTQSTLASNHRESLKSFSSFGVGSINTRGGLKL